MVKRDLKKIMLIVEKFLFLYGEGNVWVNKIVYFVFSFGLKWGDVVVIILVNEFDFIWMILGIV